MKGFTGAHNLQTEDRPRRCRLVVIGASTGGPRSLQAIFSNLPADLEASMLVVQHMPPRFTASLARRLDRAGGMEVLEAEAGMELKEGRALVAPGDFHLTVQSAAGEVQSRLSQGAPFNRHRPSVDITMFSAAKVFGADCMGIVLTGMGSDGARGIARIFKAGGVTVCESRSTAVIYGMPREAVKTGCIEEVLPLTDIPQAIVEAVTALR